MKSGQRKYLKRCGLDIHVHNVQRRFESNADCPYIYIYHFTWKCIDNARELGGDMIPN